MRNFVILLLLTCISCSSISSKIYHQSDRFIDIEVAKDDFFMMCSDLGKEENKSLMTFYAVNEDIVHEFIFRRISDSKWCEKKVLQAYKKLSDGNRSIRLVGITSLEREKNNLPEESVPKQFKTPAYLINWTFVRMQTSKGCKAYFEQDCNPENYWAGFLPQK